MKKISIVVSAYNEEAALNEFYNEIMKVLCKIKLDYEVLFINDGSIDATGELIDGFTRKNSKVKAIHFSRNFGHEAAMIAGIDYAIGDFIVCMDADLQHPPEQIPNIIEGFMAGNDIVLMSRQENQDAGLFKKVTSSSFYKILNFITDIKFEENVSDFFGISKKVGDLFKNQYRDNVRYLRGLVQSVGFKRIIIPYVACKRCAGKSKYNTRALINTSLKAFTALSKKPLRVGFVATMLSAIVTFGLLVATIVVGILTNGIAGFLWLGCLVAFLFTILFVILSVFGEYMAVQISETKSRPIYIVDRIN